MKTLRALIVEDSENDSQLLVMELRRGGWTVDHERVDTLDAMTVAIERQQWDLIIADFSMPQFSGLAALRLARSSAASVPFMLVSGTMGEATAVAAMKAGASDYLFKGDLSRLVPAVERELRAAEERETARETGRLLDTREAQLAEALRLSKLGTWNLNLQNDSSELSEEAQLLLGCAKGETHPSFSQFIQHIHSDDRDAFTSVFFNRVVSRISQDYRLVSADAGGTFVHIRGEIVRDKDGNPTRAGGMIQDITQRKLADAELLRLKDAAEAANRAKSEFLANMSHELRTPMSAILGFADMMTRTGDHAIDAAECVSTIRRNSQHLLDLINEILDLSKIEAGQMKVERIQCDLPALLCELGALMQPRAAEKSLQITIDIQGPVPRYIQTDPQRLRQILVNLLGNAIKFTPSGCVNLTVSQKNQAESCQLILVVRDTGIGMTSEQLSRVFEPFAQAESSTTRKFGGTGLGLTISRRLARLLDGDITVSSEPNIGSAFTVTMDARNCDSEESFSNLDDPSLRAIQSDVLCDTTSFTAKILLVEDGRDNQRLLSTLLRMAGADVEIVNNGQVAVERAAVGSFDLILMDMQMPVMDGYTATAELRSRDVHTPIIALTAYAMAEDRAKCLASGCNDYLSKPVRPDSLLNMVKSHLAHSIESEEAMQANATLSPNTAETDTTGSIRSTLMNYPGLANCINEFIADLPGMVRQLGELVALQDTDRLRRVSHQLRGACGGFGFDCISEVAGKAEDAIRRSEPPLAISNCIDSLIQIIQRVEGFDRRKSRIAA
jgi:signal transduction histidine kinase/DNA-binding response OmpR family regulator